MKFFRLPFIREAMILFTGITFLNMGFFLAEVTALKIPKDTKLIQSIAGNIFEEEREHGAESAPNDSAETEIDLLSHHTYIHQISPGFTLCERRGIIDDPFSDNYHLEIFCPPPEA
jgi:hypothetical protein